jgi:DDE superfamily endonuclease
MNKNRVPKASPEPLPELAAFLEPFAPLFRRHSSQESMERYLTGLLTDLPHKTCDTIAQVIAGTSIERLQHLLTDAAWDPLSLDEARVKRLLALHPMTHGILVFDDTGLPKKGSASVGVAPQYSGTLGKIGNCQVVVSAEYLADDPASSTPFHFPVSAQLFLPESWAQDAERRKQAQVPEEIRQQTKPEIALGLLDRARQWGVPIQAVVVDAGYGDNPNFLRGLDDRQIPYMCAVESTFGCRLPDEVQASAAQTPVYGGCGQPRKPQYISLKDLLSKIKSERIKQLDKVKKLISRIKGLGWRHIPLLGFVLVVDLLDLTPIDTQATNGQHLEGHLVLQAHQQRLSGLLWLQGERQVDHLRQVKESFGEAEAIWVQMGLHGCLSHEGAHRVMGQKDPIEFLDDSFGRLGAQDLALSSLVRFDFVNHQFDFPALMIEPKEFEGGGHPWIEQGGHQAIHLAHFA